MKAKISEFRPVAQYILKSEFDTILEPGIDRKKVRKTLSERPFDIDFTIKENEEKSDDQFIIEVIVSNKKNRKPGYKLYIRAAFFYRVDNFKEMDIDLQNQYIFFTALPMSINHVRNSIANLTSEGIYGKYILPAVDLKQLIDDWEKQQTVDE